LINIKNDCKWKYLERITPPRRHEDLRVYIACSLKHRNYLTHLLLCDSLPDRQAEYGDNKVINTVQYSHLSQTFHQFSPPTHLEQENNLESNCLVENLDGILEGCQLLQSFRFNIRLLHRLNKIIMPAPTSRTLDLPHINPAVNTQDL
jgi:hypothetical protein